MPDHSRLRLAIYASVVAAVALLTFRVASSGSGSVAAAEPDETESRGESGTEAQAPASFLAGIDFTTGPSSRSLLPAHLREISGLAVDARGRVLTHADERGVVTELAFCGDSVVPSIRLGSPPVADDFEGIVAIGPRIVLITSSGKLYGADYAAGATTVQFTVVETGLGNACEIEGLGWNEAEDVLVAGCKELRNGRNRGRSDTDSVAFLKWSLSEARAAGVIALSSSELASRTGQRRFRPSAVEFVKATGTYIALAGPERSIAEFTPDGRVLAALRLDRNLHRQPEGLAILGDSLLMIADEGGNGQGAVACYRRRG